MYAVQEDFTDADRTAVTVLRKREGSAERGGDFSRDKRISPTASRTRKTPDREKDAAVPGAPVRRLQCGGVTGWLTSLLR